MSTSQQQIRDMKREIDALKSSLAEYAETKISNGHIPLSTEELRDMARETGRNLKLFFRTKGRQAAHAVEEVEDSIRTRPITATAVAFAAGALVAALFGRR